MTKIWRMISFISGLLKKNDFGISILGWKSQVSGAWCQEEWDSSVAGLVQGSQGSQGSHTYEDEYCIL